MDAAMFLGWTRRALAAASLLGAVLASPPAAAEPEDARPLLEAHCFDCHGNGAAEGTLALDKLLAAEDAPATRDRWRKVWFMVRQEFMPPVDAERPSSADRKAMTQWIEQAALGVNYDHPDPGRVTMRRLNRMEYEFTVNDLFGVDVTATENLSALSQATDARLRDMLPPDDTAYGFDNIGDFQTLSPALLDKYFDIAELIVSKVIVTEGPWYPVQRIERSSLHVSPDRETQRTEHEAKFEIVEPGHYRVDVQFYLGGWQEYGGGFDFQFAFDGADVAAAKLDVGGQETHRYVREGELAAGEHVVTLVTKAVKPDSEGRLVNLQLKPQISITGPIAPERRSYPESHQQIFFAGAPPTDPLARRRYAHDILERVASRAFRRPVDEATVERLADLATAEENFERGIGNGLLAILTSPRFLFRTELQPQPDDPATRHKLDDDALASRLSYLIWLSMPDDELTNLAAAGTLREHMAEQVQRVLADPKSERFLEDFAGQWLRTRNVLMTPISRREEELDPLRGAMKRESDMLFAHVVRNDRDLLELVTADYTFVNERLARHYGIADVRGDEFRRVNLPPESHRGGILTQGSFLVSTSNPDRTSPVKRGLFVLENLLATQPPAPPANVPPLEAAHVDGKALRTVRELLEAHRADPSCAACHAHFDPIGVALENFDLLGQWRDEERREPIDPSGTTVTGEELSGVDDLRDYIAGNRERYYRCVTEKLLTYALGRGLEPYDAVTVDRIADKLMANGGKFSTLLLAVIESPAFQTRRGDDASELQLAAGVKIPEIPPPDQRRPQRRRGRFRDRERPRAEATAEPEVEATVRITDPEQAD